MAVSVLDLMGGFAVLAKGSGLLSTLSAPESYLDPFTSEFDRSLTHAYPEWARAGVDFAYHGRNCLAYVVAVYGEAFDLVSLQLYESYSHADFAINVQQADPGVYLAHYMQRLTAGWRVDFSSDRALAIAGAGPELGAAVVGLPRHKIVLGFANAWGGRGRPVKALYLPPHALYLAHQRLLSVGMAPRGYMLWSLGSEGENPVNRAAPLHLAWWFADILGAPL